MQQLKNRELLKRFDVLVIPHVTNDPRAIVSGLPMVWPPIPWRRTSETPNIGVLDSTDDVRPGIGLDGMAALQDWLATGGVVITEGGTNAVFTE